MSKTERRDDGGPAFPAEQHETQNGEWNQSFESGMSLRDYFAAKALQGVLYLVAHDVHDAASSAEGCALEAYKLADAMLRARKEQGR